MRRWILVLVAVLAASMAMADQSDRGEVVREMVQPMVRDAVHVVGGDRVKPVARFLDGPHLVSTGRLRLGQGENNRVARSMYWDADAGIYKYAETVNTASQIVANSDFFAADLYCCQLGE